MNENPQENQKPQQNNPFTGDNLRSILKKIEAQRDAIRGKPKERIVLDNPSKEQIIEQLRTGDCTVYFAKVTDGTQRTMKCTLIPAAWPAKYKGKKSTIASIFADAASGKHGKQFLIPVWDLEASQWRSFYTNRVSRLIRDENTPII